MQPFFFYLSPNSFYFSFPCSFLGGFSGSFCFWSFSCQKTKTFGTFSNIQQGNALAFTATYTLIFVNVLTSSNTSFTFLKFFVFLLLKVNWRGGEDSFTNSLRCTTMQSFWADNAYEFSFKEKCCYLRKNIIKVNGTFMLLLYISFRTVTLWRNTQALPSMSTMLVTSGLKDVTAAVVDGISPSMEPSAALLELLTVHSICKQAETTIFTVTATLKVIAITFRKEMCEWHSRLENASQDKSLLTPTLVGIQWIVSLLRKYRKLSGNKCHVMRWTFQNRIALVFYYVLAG